MLINSIMSSETGPALEPGERAGGASFAGAITKLIREVNSDQVEAAQKIQELAVEGKGTIHGAMVSMSNATGSFRLLMEMRNRIVEGVNQLLSSQV